MNRIRSRLPLRMVGLALFCVVVVGTPELAYRSKDAFAGAPLTRLDFNAAAPQGFGDRQNSWAWAMQWWKGYLYVGTNRAWFCATSAPLNILLPSIFPYPPADPDVDCAANYRDLPLQAEIWRWSPVTNVWERVFQSPNDVPVPNATGKFVGRDVAFRGMSIFIEADGTEALYVGGVASRFIYGDNVPPPRILRSTDGVNWTPLPQNPTSLLGSVQCAGFRGNTSFNGKFYIICGSAQGAGLLLEAANPAGGNDNFRVVSPKSVAISSVLAYNGALYMGVENLGQGYQVLKTTAAGELPYTYQTIVDKGGNLPSRPNVEILSMKVFKDKLYLGANGVKALSPSMPAEVIRINSDDSWDLVVGTTRTLPTGELKTPISGFAAGFGNPYNYHMWRMEIFEDQLYVGTFDGSTAQKEDPSLPPLVRQGMGCDLYRTGDGTNYTPVTTTCFGDPLSFGVRTMQATPYGLFVGTANYYYGLQVFRGVPSGLQGFSIYLPVVARPLEN